MTNEESFLERRMAGMRPRPLAQEVKHRIAAELSRPQPVCWPDRCLLAAITAGAAAACVIAAILVQGLSADQGPTAQLNVSATVRFENSPLALARNP